MRVMTHKKTNEEKEIKEIIEKSGNRLHVQVVNLLRKEGWSVLVSPYYSDNFTEKPREIDIIAEKKFDVKGLMHDWLGTLDVRLFIECKYLNGKTVLWLDAKDKAMAAERIKKDTGMQYPNHDITKLHYNSDEPVAKLFASEKGRGGEQDVWSKAINQNLNALVYYRSRGNIFPSEEHRAQKRLKSIAFPLIICNSFEKLYATEIADENETIKNIGKPFQLEVNYAYIDNNVVVDNHRGDARNEYFLIDVMSVDLLSEFLGNLEKTDIAEVRNKIMWEKRRTSS